MLVIHVGGLAQLILLSGDPATAFRLGFRPFFANDLVKVGLAALLILGLRPRLRIR
jgi:biotin transporter BioY